MRKQVLEIKEKIIGQGKPIVCVPVMEAKREDILFEVSRLVDLGAQMIEWRVDAFEEVSSLNTVEEVLVDIGPIVKNTIFLFTFRTKKQGGLLELEEEKLCKLWQVAAESHVVDLVDVEYFKTDITENTDHVENTDNVDITENENNTDNADNVDNADNIEHTDITKYKKNIENADNNIRLLQSMGVKVVASHHDFHKTPVGENIAALLEQMAASGADIVKLAVMPQSTEDVLRLLEATNAFHKKYPHRPLITMSMGQMGVISRISGEAFGSCVTFGAGKVSSAPGQLPMATLQNILNVIGSC